MRGRLIIAAVLGVVGLVWVAQGLDLLQGSGFMDGDVRWAAAGAVLVGVAVVLGVSADAAPAGGLSQAVHAASARPAVTSSPNRTNGRRSSRWSASSRSATSRSSIRRCASPPSRYGLDVSSSKALAPSRSTKRRSSAGAIGRLPMSTKLTTIRRSRKNRIAPRVGCDASVPKTWMLGILRVGVLPSGAGTVRPAR